MKKIICVLALLCAGAVASDVADNASERTPPPEVLGKTYSGGPIIYDAKFFSSLFQVFGFGKDSSKEVKHGVRIRKAKVK